MSEWYHRVRWYTPEAIASMKSKSVKDRVHRVLGRVGTIWDKSVCGFSETRKLETMLDTLNDSGLDKVNDVRRKAEDVKAALDNVLVLIGQLEASALELSDEMWEQDEEENEKTREAERKECEAYAARKKAEDA